MFSVYDKTFGADDCQYFLYVSFKTMYYLLFYEYYSLSLD